MHIYDKFTHDKRLPIPSLADTVSPWSEPGPCCIVVRNGILFYLFTFILYWSI